MHIPGSIMKENNRTSNGTLLERPDRVDISNPLVTETSNRRLNNVYFGRGDVWDVKNEVDPAHPVSSLMGVLRTSFFILDVLPYPTIFRVQVYKDIELTC